MVLPAGVITVALTFGPYLDEQGDSLNGQVTVKGVSRLWTATGSVFYAKGITKSFDNEGTTIFFLPATDQDGYTDGHGNAIDDWQYQVLIEVSGAVPREYYIPLPAAGAP